MIFNAMIPAIAIPAARAVRAHIQNRLIIARCAAAGRAATVSRLGDEWGARLKRPPVCVSIVISKILHSVVRGAERCPPCRRSAALQFKGRESHATGV